MSASLEELFNAVSRRGRGCFICGDPNAAFVSVRLLELGENGRIAAEGKTVSKGRSFCAVHAAEVYVRLRDLLESK